MGACGQRLPDERATAGAFSCGVMWRHSNSHFAVDAGQVLQPRSECPPSGVTDALGQVTVLDHGRDSEVFIGNHVVGHHHLSRIVSVRSCGVPNQNSTNSTLAPAGPRSPTRLHAPTPWLLCGRLRAILEGPSRRGCTCLHPGCRGGEGGASQEPSQWFAAIRVICPEAHCQWRCVS
jgi:hypothetical protein